MSAAALAGWVVLGTATAASLGLMGAGGIAALRAHASLKRSLVRIEQTQRRRFDPARFEPIATRLSRDAAEAQALVTRAQRAIATIATAVRFALAAIRLLNIVR
ncbi:MAG: hypothetical protein JOY98_11245 [Candidatus Eremiobacteraeota bacterium]|nr:hypothetical protein [Candidatus Eremiobacteraeota bacterium]